MRRLLILDLDETLIHATMFSLPREEDFQVGLAKGLLRPGAREFLRLCLERFPVGIWTSATAEYAADVIPHLTTEPERLAFVWTRDRCLRFEDPSTGARLWRKDLNQVAALGADPGSVLIVDDSPEAWGPHAGRVLAVSRYTGASGDRELVKLWQHLEGLTHHGRDLSP